MSADVLVLPLGPDPIATARARGDELGLEPTIGAVMKLRKPTPIADASTPNPNDPNGPTAA